MGFEVDRTASNLIELEHPKKQRKRSPEPYDLRGMVEVDHTSSNCNTKFRGGLISMKYGRILNRGTRR